MPPLAAAGSINTSAQSSQAVRMRSIESTCPRTRLILATSFCSSLSRWLVYSSDYIVGGYSIKKKGKKFSRRRSFDGLSRSCPAPPGRPEAASERLKRDERSRGSSEVAREFGFGSPAKWDLKLARNKAVMDISPTALDARSNFRTQMNRGSVSQLQM